MRVISQDGFYDVPYAQIIIECTSKVIFARDVKNNNYSAELARYSTEEKAKKAMEDLQYAYVCHNIVMFCEEKAKDIPNDRVLKAVIGSVYQFPTEEELE